MTAEPRPGSGTPDADDGHTINVGPVTVADPGSGTPDPTPNGQTWVCRNGRPTARCVEDCPVAAGCGPVPPAPSSDTPSDERLCGHCAASNDPSPAHRYIVGRVARQCPGRPAPSPVPEASGRASDLAALAARAFANSERWFPGVHDRGDEAITTHLALGLGGECGEVLDVLKKADVCGLTDLCDMHADGKHSRAALGAEMADLFTYLLNLAHHHGIDLESEFEKKQAICAERWDR